MSVKLVKAPTAEPGTLTTYTGINGVSKLALVTASAKTAADSLHPLEPGCVDLTVFGRIKHYERQAVPFSAEPADGTRSWRML